MRNPQDIHDVADLLQALSLGLQPSYLFFWGHRPRADGEVGKSCLSHWWPAAFEVDGRRYPTAEHFMMAEKARLFGDEPARARILAAAHPRQAKAIGRQVRGFDEERWQQHRLAIVARGNDAKFSQNPRLGSFLLGTHGRVLVEASPVDRVWGIGLGAGDPRATDPRQWRGLNLLGFALMQTRSRLPR